MGVVVTAPKFLTYVVLLFNKVMEIIISEKLKTGDEVRVIAPSCAKGTLSSSVIEAGEAELRRLGLVVSWGENSHIIDSFECAPIATRVADLHAAFLDKNVKAILAVRGGFYANQLLDYIDWNIIKNNPKVFCGFSDITVLQNAMLARTGLVSYSGPNLSYIGKSGTLGYTLDYFKKCLFSDEPFKVQPSDVFQSFDSQEGMQINKNSGWYALQDGEALGTIVGGNLCTLNLLQGTKYMPSLQNSILFLEDDVESKYRDFDRNFQSLIHLPEFTGVKGILFGRFQDGSKITKEMLQSMVAIRPELRHVPILANVDFGHTEPKLTFPIGGTARLVVNILKPQLSGVEILTH